VPKYIEKDQKWNVVVDRNGTQVELHPTHIIIAAGTLGAPHIPDVDGCQEFLGQTLHASKFIGAQSFIGKRAVVMGAGNTAANICQDQSVGELLPSLWSYENQLVLHLTRSGML
jgi:cation diffusion facilitator CzcD-associated flavoprotein CzcO